MITISDIQEVSKYCIRLLNCTEYLRRDSSTKEAYEFAERIMRALQKLSIASTIQNKMIICVSGLQGSGKTTLMKNFYSLDGSFLNITHGRGERIPILITEKRDITVPVMLAVRIEKDENGEFHQKKSKLSADDFISASRGEDARIMYLELYVPHKHTFNEGISFMLLPGFEKKNNYWNDLVEFSVNSSDAAVFVFDDTSFSNADNDRRLRELEEKFGENIVYAITHSDGSPDDNAEVKRTCIETLKIPENERDRVVCVGEYRDENKNQRWINEFKDSLDKYAYSGTQHFQKNGKYIYDVITEIKSNLYQIMDILNDDISEEMREYQENNFLKAFDKAALKKRNELERNLEIEFNKAYQESVKKLEKQFNERPKIGNIRRFFFGISVRDMSETREMVQSSLRFNSKFFLPDMHLGSALKNTLEAFDAQKVKNDIGKLVDINKEKGRRELKIDGEKSQALKDDMVALLSDSGQGSERYALKSTNYKQLMSAMAQFGTYYYSYHAYERVAKYIGLSSFEPAQSEIDADAILNGANSSKHFVMGMAGLLGIDVFNDGTINFCTQIADALGVAAPVTNGIALIAVGAGAASVIMKDINRMERNDLQSAKLVVRSVYDNLQREALNDLDQYTNWIRERIEANISELNGDLKKSVKKYNAKVEINNALDILDRIQEAITGSAYGVGASFF